MAWPVGCLAINYWVNEGVKEIPFFLPFFFFFYLERKRGREGRWEGDGEEAEREREKACPRVQPSGQAPLSDRRNNLEF